MLTRKTFYSSVELQNDLNENGFVKRPDGKYVTTQDSGAPYLVLEVSSSTWPDGRIKYNAVISDAVLCDCGNEVICSNPRVNSCPECGLLFDGHCERIQIPELEFQKDYGFEVPKKVIRWEYSTTFGRWGALVEFNDGTRVFTYPKENYIPPWVETQEERKNQLLDILDKFVDDFDRSWEGVEWGKAIMGNAVIQAAQKAGATDDEIKKRLDRLQSR